MTFVVLAVFAITGGAVLTGIATPVGADVGCDLGDGMTNCQGDRTEGGDDDGEGGDDGGGNESTEPPVGKTKRVYRYTLCVPYESLEVDAQSETTVTCENEDEEPYWVDFRIVRYNGNRWVPQTDWEVDSMVIREMDSADLPTGSISVNPPNGRTLVNLDTVFATDQGETQIPLTLEEVGVEIQLHLTPVAYHWDFGDGETATWETKGRPWEEGVPMSEYHTYAYSDTDTYDVTLTIEYQVEWNAGDGWQTIAGTSESDPSDPYAIEVVEKRNRLRDGD